MSNCSVTSESTTSESKYLAYLEEKETSVLEDTQQINKTCSKIAHLELHDDSELSAEEKKALEVMLDVKAALNLIPSLKEKVSEVEKAQSKQQAKEEKQKSRNEKVLRCEMSAQVNVATDVLTLLASNKMVQSRLQIARNGEEKPALTKEEMEKLVAFVNQENKLMSGDLKGADLVEMSRNFGSKIFMMLTGSKDAVDNIDVTYAQLNECYQKVLDSKLLTKIPFKALCPSQGASEQPVKKMVNGNEKPKVNGANKKQQGQKQKGNNPNGERAKNGRGFPKKNGQQARGKREVSR